MALTTTPSSDQLRRALAIQEKIDALQADLVAVLGGQGGSTTSAAPKKGRGKGRKNAAKASADSSDAASETPVKRKKKRTMSPEAREKIAAAQRKRWAKQKKA
jgi:hypothetical protein